MRAGPAAADLRATARVGFAEALRFWAKLGFISFGGPAGQIAIMHRELVERRRWISETRFLHALNFCMLLPGPEAQQLATYIGWTLHRMRGGLAAGILFVLPSAVILYALSWLYAVYGTMPAADGVLSGFKAVVVAIVAEALLRIGRRSLRGPAHLLVAGAAFTGIHFFGVSFPLIIMAAAMLGILTAGMWPAGFGEGFAAAAPPGGEEQHEPAPPARTLRVLATGLALWVVPALAIIAWLGAGSLPLRQYAFFTSTALVTFGGAYAVLAYVAQAAVQSYGWITPAQAVDGLALAETTPGPLIMVLQFVGFVTGWNHPGELGRPAAATLGALAATWATFLPSIVFVLAGAPYVEKLRGSKWLGAALSGVTAAVIGAILNLAITFGTAVILPSGVAGGIDWFPVLVGSAAFVALHRLKAGVVWVVLAGGAAGMARALSPI